jgi:uncharacterized membrane protein YciS (DUF1049 family)
MKDQVVTILIVIAMFMIGRRLVHDSRESRKSGIARIIFQWPGDFDRETNPSQFRLSVFLATWVGYGLIIAAGFGVIGIFLKLMLPIEARH